MTYLIVMLAVAAAMVLFREPLGRGLVRAAGAVDWKWAVILAILALAVWGIVHHVQAPVAIEGDALAGLFDTFAYGDLLIGLAAALLSRQVRQLPGRLIDLARPAVQLMLRRAGRARRAPARPRRRPPDRDEPEPGAFGGVLTFG